MTIPHIANVALCLSVFLFSVVNSNYFDGKNLRHLLYLQHLTRTQQTFAT